MVSVVVGDGLLNSSFTEFMKALATETKMKIVNSCVMMKPLINLLSNGSGNLTSFVEAWIVRVGICTDWKIQLITRKSRMSSSTDSSIIPLKGFVP